MVDCGYTTCDPLDPLAHSIVSIFSQGYGVFGGLDEAIVLVVGVRFGVLGGDVPVVIVAEVPDGLARDPDEAVGAIGVVVVFVLAVSRHGFPVPHEIIRIADLPVDPGGGAEAVEPVIAEALVSGRIQQIGDGGDVPVRVMAVGPVHGGARLDGGDPVLEVMSLRQGGGISVREPGYPPVVNLRGRS